MKLYGHVPSEIAETIFLSSFPSYSPRARFNRGAVADINSANELAAYKPTSMPGVFATLSSGDSIKNKPSSTCTVSSLE